MKTITSIDLTNVTGGGKAKFELKKGEDKDLFRVKKSGKKGVVPAIAPGDFGAPASSFIPITGD